MSKGDGLTNQEGGVDGRRDGLRGNRDGLKEQVVWGEEASEMDGLKEQDG